MTDGAGWDENAFEEEIAAVDWAGELAEISDKETIAGDAMTAVNHWLQLPAATKPPTHGEVSRGDVVWNVYMKALGKVHGYDDWEQMTEDNPELARLYNEIIHGLLANGVIIPTETEQVLASEFVLSYLEDEGDGAE